MLAWRVVIRPGTLRSKLQRRFIFPSRSQLQALPRPNTWLAKIRFRVDGKPRSKLIALGFGALILLNSSLLYKLNNLIEGEERVQSFMARIIYIQYMDTTYDSVNFDDPISTQSYYEKLYRAFSPGSKEEIDKEIDIMMGIFKKDTEIGSKISAEVQAHHIMRSAAEKIHGAFRELNRDSPHATTAIFVMDVIRESETRLFRLVRACIDEYHKYANAQMAAIDASLGHPAA